MVDIYKKLVSYVDDIKERNNSSASSLVIIKDGSIVLEHYSGFHSNSNAIPISETSQFNVASARKSYIGLAIAYALYEGEIKSLDDYAIDYLDSYDKELLAGTTIRHLVTHSHGLNERMEGNIFREFAPGEGWAYRGINILMMTEIIKKLYGKSFPELLKERLFLPLGFKETAWHSRPNKKLVQVIDNPNELSTYKLGSSNDGFDSNLHTSAREFALWGNLHLNNGVVNGKQVVPKEVIQLATRLQNPTYKDKDLPQNGLFW